MVSRLTAVVKTVLFVVVNYTVTTQQHLVETVSRAEPRHIHASDWITLGRKYLQDVSRVSYS